MTTAPIRTIEAPIGWDGRALGSSATIVAPLSCSKSFQPVGVDHASDHGSEPDPSPEGDEETQPDG